MLTRNTYRMHRAITTAQQGVLYMRPTDRTYVHRVSVALPHRTGIWGVRYRVTPTSLFEWRYFENWFAAMAFATIDVPWQQIAADTTELENAA